MNIDVSNIFTWIAGFFASLIAMFISLFWKKLDAVDKRSIQSETRLNSMVDTIHEFKNTNERLGKLETQTQTLLDSQQRIEDHFLNSKED